MYLVWCLHDEQFFFCCCCFSVKVNKQKLSNSAAWLKLGHVADSLPKQIIYNWMAEKEKNFTVLEIFLYVL